MRKLLVLAVLLLVVGGGTYWLTERPEQSDDPPWLQQATVLAGEARSLYTGTIHPLWADTAEPAAPRYATAPIERGKVRETVTATGSLNASVTVEVGSQLSGQIAELFADFNDEVAKGEPLARLDTRTLEARLAEARAATQMAETSVEVQKAKIERARVDLGDAETRSAVLQARLDIAKVRLHAAESVLERLETLRERGSASSVQLEQALTERDSTAASLREAEALYDAHGYAVAGAKADLRRAEAELANILVGVPHKKAAQWMAEIDLDRTTIRSPIDGVVVGRNIDEGQTVAASLEAPTLFTIAGSLEQMEIHARVDEADIGKIAVGQPASFTVDAHPGWHFEADVTGIRKAPQVVQNVVTYTVVLETDNPDNLLLPGMTATVRVTVQESAPGPKLPMAALRFSPSQEPARDPAGAAEIGAGHPAAVWRMRSDGTIEPIAVGLGSDDGSHAAVLAGAVAEGDEIVVGEVIEEAPRQIFGIRVGF